MPFFIDNDKKKGDKLSRVFAALLFVQLNFIAMKQNMVKFILQHLVTILQLIAANYCGSMLRMKWYLMIRAKHVL